MCSKNYFWITVTVNVINTLWVSVCVHACMCIHVCMCVCVCMHVCIHTCIKTSILGSIPSFGTHHERTKLFITTAREWTNQQLEGGTENYNDDEKILRIRKHTISTTQAVVGVGVMIWLGWNQETKYLIYTQNWHFKHKNKIKVQESPTPLPILTAKAYFKTQQILSIHQNVLDGQERHNEIDKKLFICSFCSFLSF